tara:strand:- start:465 stop:590 length:126 start_codon:yes stop_codon:yes gene_type:complete
LLQGGEDRVDRQAELHELVDLGALDPRAGDQDVSDERELAE